jgi:hypothetical protein
VQSLLLCNLKVLKNGAFYNKFPSTCSFGCCSFFYSLLQTYKLHIWTYWPSSSVQVGLTRWTIRPIRPEDGPQGPKYLVDIKTNILEILLQGTAPLTASVVYGQSSWLYNGVILCFLWGSNWIYICYVEESRPPLWSSCQGSWRHNGDVLCFLWGTNWICICYADESRQPLWSSGQSSWLQIQRPGLDSRCYQIFWEVVGLEEGPLRLVNTSGELLQRKSSGSAL